MSYSDMDAGLRKYLFEQTKQPVLVFTNVLRAPSWDYLLIREDDGLGKDVLPRKNKTGAPTDDFIKFLRSSNSNGYNVYARPNTNRHVLIDDIKQSDIDRMIADGLRPNMVIETSPDNYQVWLTLSKDEVAEDLSVKAQRLLTYRYCGDKHAVGRKRIGRLPAFANRKAIHYDEATNKHPYTKLIKSSTRINAATVDLLKEAEGIILPREATSDTMPPSSRKGCALPIAYDDLPMQPDEACAIFDEIVEWLTANDKIISYEEDNSHADLQVARYMELRGYEPEETYSVVLYGSRKIAESSEDRKRSYVEDKVDTVYSDAK